MPQMNMIQALNSAMDIMLGRDPNVVCSARTWAISAACSASPTACSASTASTACSTRRSLRGDHRRGHRHGRERASSVAEVQFADYIYPACDQIFSELARLRYRCAGEFWAPVTIRTPCGGGIRAARRTRRARGHLHARVRHQGRDAVHPTTPRGC